MRKYRKGLFDTLKESNKQICPNCKTGKLTLDSDEVICPFISFLSVEKGSSYSCPYFIDIGNNGHK